MSFPRAQTVTRLGDSSTDPLKAVWSTVPFALIRLTGGSGKWTDPLTHAVLTDAQSDLRKSAVVASAISAFNDPNNFWYDVATQAHLTPAQTWARWQALFGSATFAQAYGSFPGQFAIFNPTNSTGDPVIHAPGAPVPTPTPTVTAPGASLLSPPPVIPTVISPLTSASATPQQIASATPAQIAAANAAVAAATPTSSSTWLLLGAAAVGFLIWSHKRRGATA